MSNPYAAYGNVQKNIESGRETDAFVLEKSSFQLMKAKTNEFSWYDAVKYNQQVWTVIQAALLDDGNTLPNDVRSNLLNLSNYVDKRSFEIIGDMNFEPSKLDVLININQNIALGLRGNPGTV